MGEPAILDACCGSKMFWFNRERSDTVFMDNRRLETTLCDGRTLKIAPDIVADFRNIPFPDNSFKLVVFDPPHLVQAGETSWMRLKYGCLEKDTWRDDIRRGFTECMRVLEEYGILIFKWNEDQIKLKDLLSAIGATPLIGDRRAKTHWMVFMKLSREGGMASMWISVSERLPEKPEPVLVVVKSKYGSTYILRAMHAKQFELIANDDDAYCEDWAEYNEGEDEYYCPQGWYENNQYEETHWHIDGEVTHWQPLPAPPSAADAAKANNCVHCEHRHSSYKLGGLFCQKAEKWVTNDEREVVSGHVEAPEWCPKSIKVNGEMKGGE